jgi:tRNA threonylcarbamoyladenosine modification (KEOPS) complex Cgi121 subunit
LTALLRLSKRSIRLPSCLYVTGIRQIERSLELQTPTTDIFHGTHRGQRVILKRYKFCTGMLSLEAQNQVRFSNKSASLPSNSAHFFSRC